MLKWGQYRNSCISTNPKEWENCLMRIRVGMRLTQMQELQKASLVFSAFRVTWAWCVINVEWKTKAGVTSARRDKRELAWEWTGDDNVPLHNYEVWMTAFHLGLRDSPIFSIEHCSLNSLQEKKIKNFMESFRPHMKTGHSRGSHSKLHQWPQVSQLSSA